MIMTTYCKRFHPQVPNQTIAELQNSTDKEIQQMLQTPMTLQMMIKKTILTIDFNLPTLSRLTPPQHESNTQHQTNSNNPIQIIGLNTSTFNTKTTKEKTQTVLANINLLLQDQVEPTQIYQAIDIIKIYNNDKINKMMMPTGLKEFTQGLQTMPTTYWHGSYSHRLNIKYHYNLKIYHTSLGYGIDIG